MEDVTKRKDLISGEAIEKLKELLKDAGIGMFTTHLSKTPLTSRPMSVIEVDDEGYVWFFSSKLSNKNLEITQDKRVQVFFANKTSSEYLSLYGEADIITDKQKIDELWIAIAKAWFEDGKDDPDVSLIRVRPLDVHYWDTKHNRFVALIKIAVAAVTGKQMDDSVEGSLYV